MYCYNCLRDRQSICRGCDVCPLCCECPKIKFFKCKPKFHSSTKFQHKNNITDRFIAAEIEVANIKSKAAGKRIVDVVRKWEGSIVRDGSIPEGGFEINTAPASGDLFLREIKEICTELSAASATVTEACGLHVHLDARDFNYYDIRRLVKVYAAIEPALFDMVPYQRRRLHYCTPCGDKYEQAVADGKLPYKKVKADVVVSTYKVASTRDRTRKYSEARYNALNLHSWFYRGTIECRIFNGTVKADEIIRWGILWAHILDYALHTSDEDIIRDMNKSHPLKSLNFIVQDNKILKNFIKARHNQYKRKAV